MAEDKGKDVQKEGTEAKAKGSGAGFLLGAILGVVLSVALGFITVGLLLPPRQGAGKKAQAEEESDKKPVTEKASVPELTFNVAGTRLKVVGQAECKLEYKTLYPEKAKKQVQERMDTLESELRYFLSSKTIQDLDGGENQRRLAHEALKIAQKVLFLDPPEGEKPKKDAKPLGQVTHFWFTKLLAQ